MVAGIHPPVYPAFRALVRRTVCCSLALAVCSAASAQGAPGLSGLGFTADLSPASCTAGGAGRADWDLDGLSDHCEEALAVAFRPLLRESPHDDLRREPWWAARPLRERGDTAELVAGVRVIYLLAYARDLGWAGAACRLERVAAWLRHPLGSRWDPCSGHAGDSEFVVLDLGWQPVRRRWKTARLFLSAHWGNRIDDSRWISAGDPRLEWADVPGGIPVVWVSERKHANYLSWAACERGHLRLERCPKEARAARLTLAEGGNLGSRAHPAANEPDRAGKNRFGCVRSRLGLGPGVECFWQPGRSFDGWGTPTPGFRTTGYEAVLRAFGF